MSIAIRPKSAIETKLLHQWFECEGVDCDRTRSIEAGDNTQREDDILIERIRRGIGLRYLMPGPSVLMWSSHSMTSCLITDNI